MGMKHRSKSRKGNRGKYGPRKQDDKEVERVRDLIEKKKKEENARARIRAKQESKEARGWTRYTINSSKECLDPYAEHTVRWKLTISQEPYTKMYETVTLNHSEMMRLISPGLKLERLVWVKGYCSNNRHHYCFGWYRGDRPPKEQEDDNDN